MHSVIGVSILALLLAQNVQIVLSVPVPANGCVHSFRIEAGMSCGDAAVKCGDRLVYYFVLIFVLLQLMLLRVTFR